MSRLTCILAVLLSGVVLPGFGQGNIDSEEVVYWKQREIELPQISREFENLEYKSKSFKPTQTYDYIKAGSYQANVDAANHKVRVLTTKKDDLEKLYQCYLTAGFGNYGTTILNYHFANKRSKEWRYGLNLDHFASANGPVENSGISDNTIDGYITRFVNGHELGAKLLYDRSAVRFYGFDQNLDQDTDPENVRQIYNKVGLELNAAKGSSGKLSYDVKLPISNYSSSWFSETKLGYDGEVQYTLNQGQLIKVASELSSDGISIQDSTLSRMIFKALAGFEYSKDKLKVFGGARIAMNKDTILNAKNVHLYPVINASYDLNDKVQLNLNVDGDLERNNYETITEENPFIDTASIMFDNNRTLGIEAGAKLGLATGLFLNAQAGFQSFENHHMFAGMQDSTRFIPLWNTGVVNNPYVKMGAEYHLKKVFATGVSLRLNGYQVENYESVSYMPSWEIELFGHYKIQDKVEFQLNGNILGGMKGYNLETDEFQDVPTILDLRLQAQYNLSKRFSIFLLGNNLIAKKYQYYINYPKKAFNFSAGINYTFLR